MGAWDTSSEAATGSSMSAATLLGPAAPGGRASRRLWIWRAVTAAWRSACQPGRSVPAAASSPGVRSPKPSEASLPADAVRSLGAGSCCSRPPPLLAAASCSLASLDLSPEPSCRELSYMLPPSLLPMPVVMLSAPPGCAKPAERFVSWSASCLSKLSLLAESGSIGDGVFTVPAQNLSDLLSNRPRVFSHTWSAVAVCCRSSSAQQ